MDAAENSAMSHQNDKVDPAFQYYNSKEMLLPDEPVPQNITKSLDDRSLDPPYVPPSYIVLEPHKHFFDIAVNISLSSVHVPTNVYDRGMFDIQYHRFREIISI